MKLKVGNKVLSLVNSMDIIKGRSYIIRAVDSTVVKIKGSIWWYNVHQFKKIGPINQPDRDRKNA